MHHDKTYIIDELRKLLATLEDQTFKAENKAETYESTQWPAAMPLSSRLKYGAGPGA